MGAFYDMVLYFFLFSFCGWVCETSYRSVVSKAFVNPGFLNGPVCPIYGLGSIAVIYFLAPLRDDILLLFLGGMVICTVLEYVTSYVLEKLFHTTWWDYSDFKFNIGGRVCLSFSLLFGALAAAAKRILMPLFTELLERLPDVAKPWLALGLLAVFTADTWVTVYSILQLNGKLAELERATAELKSRLGSLQEKNLSLSAMLERYRIQIEEKGHAIRGSLEARGQAVQGNFDELTQKLEALRNPRPRAQHRRLLRAFPDMKSTKYAEQMNQIKAAFKAWLEGRRKGIK